MKSRRQVESKIPTTKTNTNRKKESEPGESDKKMELSLFKKNEFALILFGALLLTLIVFFLFFRSPGDNADGNSGKTGNTIQNQSSADLEKRIGTLEQNFSDKNLEKDNNGQYIKKSGSVDPIEERVARLETAFGVKFDFLIERLGNIEKKLAALDSKTNEISAKPTSSSVQKTAIKTTPAPVKTPVKTSIAKQTKAPMFHTVLKGETLYSIGKKYQISVPALQKLNKFTSNTKLYPGMNILIR
ncbi:MAG: LysM peptidoglycan-binding domain-containing protein [Pseudomonadota bacterium]